MNVKSVSDSVHRAPSVTIPSQYAPFFSYPTPILSYPDAEFLVPRAVFLVPERRISRTQTPFFSYSRVIFGPDRDY